MSFKFIEWWKLEICSCCSASISKYVSRMLCTFQCMFSKDKVFFLYIYIYFVLFFVRWIFAHTRTHILLARLRIGTKKKEEDWKGMGESTNMPDFVGNEIIQLGRSLIGCWNVSGTLYPPQGFGSVLILYGIKMKTTRWKLNWK